MLMGFEILTNQHLSPTGKDDNASKKLTDSSGSETFEAYHDLII